ncbi:MAG: 4-hydroxy-tetrahydrodipicolinate synthase [Candidatus Aenigmarchaeota archaeon]|nr:4-hydroxy-tetrahydrodipicolinate synthase [Candidatus Aenigmarchaeota archaeon]
MGLKGVFTAIVTPFKTDGSVDYNQLKKLVEYNIDGGIDGIVPMGTTGESPALSEEEHKEVVKKTIEYANGRVKIIAGAGSNCTKIAVELTKFAKSAGADAVLSVNPYYNKPTQEGLFEHFSAVAEVGIPVVVYNIKGRTGVNVQTKTLMKLAQNKNIVAVKEASGDLQQMMDVIAQRPDGFNVISGDDNMTFPLICLGGDGVISVASNLVPEWISKMVKYALGGDIQNAKKMHFELLPLLRAIFIETNPIPIKASLAMKGLIDENYRLPLCKMKTETRNELKQVLEKMKII